MGMISQQTAQALPNVSIYKQPDRFSEKVSIPKKFHCNYIAVKSCHSIPMLYTLSFTIREKSNQKSLVLNYELSDSGTLSVLKQNVYFDKLR